MAAGDVVTALASVAAGAVLAMQPAAGSEWSIHNITYDGAVEFHKVNGTITQVFDSDTGAGGRLEMLYHCTNAVWYEIKNTGSVTINIGYDGIQTK